MVNIMSRSIFKHSVIPAKAGIQKGNRQVRFRLKLAKSNEEINTMEKKSFIYYQEEEMWIGWLEEFPDYRTQGETLDDLKENLKDIFNELTSGRII